MSKARFTGVGAISAAFFAALCCIGPPLVLALGVGAGLVSAFAPLRPLFGALMVLFLAVGFYLVYFRAPRFRVDPDEATDGRAASAGRTARAHRRDRLLLWAATGVALALWSLPLLLDLFGTPRH